MKITDTNLIKSLTAQNIKAEAQKETNQIYFMLSHEEAYFPSFIRTLDGGNLLQIMVFIPVNVQKEGKENLSRFLHMANKELDMPGFGMDEVSSSVFYRVVIPTLDQNIEETLFNAYIKTSHDVCATFSSIIQALSVGAITMEEVLLQLKKGGELAESQAGTGGSPMKKLSPESSKKSSM
jgi:hypothetical protein